MCASFGAKTRSHTIARSGRPQLMRLCAACLAAKGPRAAHEAHLKLGHAKTVLGKRLLRLSCAINSHRIRWPSKSLRRLLRRLACHGDVWHRMQVEWQSKVYLVACDCVTLPLHLNASELRTECVCCKRNVLHNDCGGARN